MSKTHYTNVAVYGNNILFRGIKEGRRQKLKIQYSPTLFLSTNKPSIWKGLNGEQLEPKKFETIREAKDFIKNYSEIDNFKIHGNNSFEYAFIADTQPGMIEWDLENIKVAVIDIEVGSENGFPDPTQANEPITAIAIKEIGGKMVVFGCGDFDNVDPENVVYHKCRDEYTLCKSFLQHWEDNCPDVISGWNVQLFDIPYLINRFNRILGEEYTRKLSPWGVIFNREKLIKGKIHNVFTLLGVSTLDYIDLYRWYAPGGKSQESYRLDSIAQIELGEGKISYDDYDNLHSLYKLNHQLFIEYNIKDVNLILQFEDKLKLIELALTLAYDTKTNYEDVFAQTRMWDSLIYSYLLDKNIVVPPKIIKSKSEAFEGAYVKVPQVGKHDWVASFDLNSLYPHLLMQYNLSPETIIEPSDYTQEMRDILSDGVSVEKLLTKQIDTSKLKNVTITPNGQFFRTDKRGFIPQMMDDMYKDRKRFKNLMIDAEKKYQKETDPQVRRELENSIAKYNNLQLAKKLSLNSVYGAMGSQYFRFYDLRMALAVTLAGQLSIRWIENKLNGFMNTLLKTENDYVIASDTDSIYLRLSELVNKVYGTTEGVKLPTPKVIEFMDKVCEEKIQPFIDTSYQELATYVHAHEQKMQMKREALADKGIWTAKKRYILNVYNNEGVAYEQPKLKVMGLEMVKSSTPAAVRVKMKEIIKIVMEGTEEDVHEFVEDFREKFKSLPPEDISFPRGVNGLNVYSDSVSLYKKGTPIHVKGAIIYNHFVKKMNLTNTHPLIQEGEKLKFTYLKMPNHFKDSVISFPNRIPKEFGLQDYIDYDTQFEKSFIDPVKVILDCINWQIEKRSSLESFFG